MVSKKFVTFEAVTKGGKKFGNHLFVIYLLSTNIVCLFCRDFHRMLFNSIFVFAVLDHQFLLAKA